MEMGFFGFVLFFCIIIFLFSSPSSSLPLCTNLRAPLTSKTPLGFCPYNGRMCCDSSKDLQLKTQFEGMNISDSSCASAIKSVLCSTCDQYSAKLYTIESSPRPVPLLCNSTDSTNNFCSTLWDTCQNVTILNSPFAPSLQGRGGVPQNLTSSKLTDLYQSKTDFCTAFGGSSNDQDSVCFNGKPVSLNKTEPLVPPKGLCLERIGSESYLNMVPHPDGSNRAFFSNQPGKIWLADIPEQGSGQSLGLDESTPFVDLTDEVHFDTTFGMMGMAFHPNFGQNGRFFASFNCDKVKSPGCGGRCACNSDVNCDPSKLRSSSGSHPCQYHTVVAEFSANGTASDPSKAKTAKPEEIRRIFTMGLPFINNHGGQIHFGPADGNLYIMMGDGGSDGGGDGDPFNFAQNKKSLLGKIMRVDVDNMPSDEDVVNLDLWGNYSIPRDNPFSDDKESQGEIWALGLRNPWRCSFDAERPSYFLCADTGQDRYEEVDIITKGGNYGWSLYEGPLSFNLQKLLKANNTDLSELIFPVVGYNHTDINKNEKSAAISGGYFYRSNTDPCTYGSYLYADLYASAIWSAFENPKNSGNFTTYNLPFSCAHDSPMNCTATPNSPLPALGYIFSFGQDNNKDIYILTSSGTYRVVKPSRCNYTCSKENETPATSNPRPSSSPSSGNSILLGKFMELELLFCSFLVFVGLFLL